MKISQVDTGIKPKDVEIFDSAGNSIKVTYDPMAITSELASEIKSAQKKKDLQPELVVDIITQFLISWDLEEDESTEDKPVYVPLVKARMVKVKFPVLLLVMRGVFEDMSVPELKGVDSGSTSRRTGK